MNTVAKLSFGTIILLYAIYGYVSGVIYKIPTRHMDVEDLSVSADKSVYCVLSYVAFASIFYVWALPRKRKGRVTNKRMLEVTKVFRNTKELVIASLFVLGSILQVVS